MTQFWLYWSNIEDYESCPQKFLWGHGYGAIDLGRGPGRSKAKPVKSSRHHAVMGNVIGKALEYLYNHELWRKPEELKGAILDIVKREFQFALAESYIDWNKSPQRGDLLKTCQDGALGYLRTMKAQKLLGPYARSEVDMRAWVDKYTPIAGRPDVIIRRDDTGVLILDGKNSLNPGKHTNPDQLRWYALCYYLLEDVIPDRLVFCYFRYPEGKPPPEHEGEWSGLVEVPVTQDDLRLLADRARSTYQAMREEQFDPTPSPKACQYCDYETICTARQEQKAANARKTAPKVEDNPFGEVNGVMEIGLLPPTSLNKRTRR